MWRLIQKLKFNILDIGIRCFANTGKFLFLWQQFGLRHIFRNTAAQIKAKLFSKVPVIGTGTVPVNPPEEIKEDILPASAPVGLTPKVLIIAELSIPQCKYYRVEQKVQMLKKAGIAVETESWTDLNSCLMKMQTATLVIFYRVPFFDLVKEAYKEARRLKLRIGFDIDDLVFDIEEYSQNSNLLRLPEEQQKGLLEGAQFYQDALKAADFTIASTRRLQSFMKKYNSGPSYIIPNGICPHTGDDGEEIAGDEDEIFNFPLGQPDEVIIGYGSGTSTHDSDFAICAPAVLRILKEFPETRLAIHGMLVLPEEFDEFADRIYRVDFVPFREYSSAVKRFDINLIPLEQNLFNDCKSNIKYLEASRVQSASVASPSEEFRTVITNGENGFIAKDENEWYEALKKLVKDPALRKKTGENARKLVMEKYECGQLLKSAMMPILQNEMPREAKRTRKKVLVVNILYPPMSFGGATIQTENIVDEYQKYADTCVFCGSMNVKRQEWYVTRYEHKNSPCFVCEFHATADPLRIYSNPAIGERFGNVLKALRPDLVHFHCIQYLGYEMMDECRKLDIPYITTAHDAWWICERQFMLDGDMKFCHSDKNGIDLYRCARCTHSQLLFSRWHTLKERLIGSQVILTPSDYLRDLYIKSGFPAEKVKTNHNGIIIPEKVQPHKQQKVLTFAYLGGKAGHKGYFFLRDVAAKLHGEYRLKLIDLNLKFGPRSIFDDEWQGIPVEIDEPFEHQDMGEFYKGIDVLLLPSCAKESFGLTVREALARNIWVITTDAGGDITKDLKDGVNGDFLPLFDEEGFAAAMQRLIDNPQRLDGYRNPAADSITTISEQVAEIADILRRRGFDM